MKNKSRWSWLAALALASAPVFAAPEKPPVSAPAHLTPGSKTPAKGIPFAQSVKTRVNEALDELQKDGDFEKAQSTLGQLFDQVIAYTPGRDTEPFRDAAFALRLVTQLESAPKDARPDLLRYLRANDNLARTLTFLIRGTEKPADVYALLDRLRKQRGELLDKYATLAAAICVVHDRPLERHINENKPKAADPIAIFDYYVKNESKMYFGIKPVPAELLIYVVDTTASIDEMEWALSRYARDPKVGGRFFDIKYDYNHLRRGTPKQVTLEGFNLPNILQYGGVCADQAYFAMSVGKAIGVPTAYASGASGDVAHAWVGFLQSNGSTGWWNFDIGRYEAYKGVRGVVMDPQLREGIPDSFVALLAELIGTRPADRQSAVALTDAAVRLMVSEKGDSKFNPPALPEGVVAPNLPKPRTANIDAELELLDLAVRQSPGDRWSWLPLWALAREGRLTLDQKKKWSDMLARLCGQKYPDFALTMIVPMVQTVADVQEQNKLWNAAFNMFRSRADLSATVRMYQAEMWEKKGQIDTAGQCYMDVIERYANAGPFVRTALEKAEQALKDTKRTDRIPLLYEQTWTRINKPKEMAGPFMAQSNWFVVGSMFYDKLMQAGEFQKAAAVKQALGVVREAAE